MSKINVGEIVEVKTEIGRVRKARVTAICGEGFQVLYGGETTAQYIPMELIQSRVVLPWRPADLSPSLIVFRRRIHRTEDFIHDLRVRRDLIRRLLRLFTLPGRWREHRDVEPLHAYCTAVDRMDDREIDEVFPEADFVPQDLNWRELDDEDAQKAASLTQDAFMHWLKEGFSYCTMATTLACNFIEGRVPARVRETVADFFQDLLQESHDGSNLGENQNET